MKNKIICFLSVLFLSISIYSKDKIKVVAPDGLPALSLIKMINEDSKIDDIDIEYKIEKLSESLVMTLMKKDADIAIVPSNLAGQLYNKGLGYKIGGTVGWGSFYVISRESLNSLKDLKGKEIATIGKGLTPDIILQTLLKKNGLDQPKDIKIDYLGSGNELAPLYLSGKKDIVVIAEPMASKILSKDKNSKINVELNQEWKNLFNVAKGYPQSTLIVSENILKENPNFLDEFINDLKDSIEFIESNLKCKAKIVRVMPNINAKVGEAISAYCFNDSVTGEDKTNVESLLNGIGQVLCLDESYFPLFGVIGGCGPAFAYMFIDAMARAGVKNGMKKSDALKISAQTVLGSAKMILESDEHPWQLIDNVCSPGGTTIEGVTSLQADGFEAAVHNAVDKALDKDKKL